MTKLKLLIDTDPGVDDALAILMAHAHADVLGLSIAAGNVGLAHTVRNALKLVEVIGADTPVFAGCATPLVLPAEDAAFVHGADGFGDTGYAPSSRRAEDEAAALSILRLSHAQAGKLVLVAIAPLTNLALALRLDPTLPRRVASLVIMGGAVTGRGNTGRVPAEFNIGFDPEAAHVVFSAFPRFTLVDWEATMRHGIAFERMQAWLDADDPRARFYASISRKTHAWSRERGRPNVLVADALAMAVALQPDIVTRAEDRHVAIELTGTHTRGATIVDWESRSGAAANARIVLDVDQARFEALVAAALGSA
ncbi:MAG TPA: nucleoside hydrolase [Rudaea sp.]|nr:nucleoside hydrolase [Rudaea sp.]